MKLTDLSNAALLAGLKELSGNERALVARMVAYLVEVEERRLHLERAHSSVFEFCVHELGMSEGEAFRRMNAARLARRFPSIIGRLERGEVHLSALVLVRDLLTNENHEELLDAIRHKTKNEVALLVAARAPKPDVPSQVQELSHGRRATDAARRAEASTSRATRNNRNRSRWSSRLAPKRFAVSFTASEAFNDKLESSGGADASSQSDG